MLGGGDAAESEMKSVCLDTKSLARARERGEDIVCVCEFGRMCECGIRIFGLLDGGVVVERGIREEGGKMLNTVPSWCIVCKYNYKSAYNSRCGYQDRVW